MKKVGSQIIDDIDLLSVHNNEETCIRPNILYYYIE